MWCRYEHRLLSASPIWRRCADKALSCVAYRRGGNKLHQLLGVLLLQTSSHYPLRWFEAYLYSSWFYLNSFLFLSFAKKDFFFYEVFVAFAEGNCKIVAKFFSPLLQSKRIRCPLFIRQSYDSSTSFGPWSSIIRNAVEEYKHYGMVTQNVYDSQTQIFIHKLRSQRHVSTRKCHH